MELKHAVVDYQPDQATIDLVQKTKITLLVGIAGAGKDSIKKELLKRDDFADIVSHTTRQPRTNNGVDEREGVDYYFIDDKTALEMVKHKAFIEMKYVHGTIYGTSTEELRKSYKSGNIAVTDIDVQGVDEYKSLSSPVIALFILPPDYDTWRQRLSSRYASLEEYEAEFPKRRASAIKELTRALHVSYYHFIINDDLNRAVQVVDEIAHRGDSFHRKDDEARLAARDLLAAIQNNS